MTLSLNENSLTGTYLGSQAVIEQSTLAFTIEPESVPLYQNDQTNSLPAFQANLTGIPADVDPYYYVDFSSDFTVVWDASCVQVITTDNGPCSAAPTYLKSVYSNTSVAVGTFTNQEFGGYLCSGSIYLDEICVGNFCKFVRIYATTVVSQNAWLYDQQGAYGILGYGPSSAYWNQFIDSEGQATYSIELATTSNLLLSQATSAQSNITLGGNGNQASYLNEASLVVSALDTLEYGLYSFGFGTVYQTNGIDTSSYFENFTTADSLLFNTNFQGLGLPDFMYTQYTTLLFNLTSNYTCATTTDGICVINSACVSNLNLWSLSFQIFFDSNSTYYMNVPLAAFAIPTASNQCSIAVSRLTTGQSASSYVILGSMFFQDFFAVFTNQYSQAGEIDSQTAQIYIQQSNNYQASYIGNQLLPTGDNPFNKPTPPPVPPFDEPNVIWIIVLCIVIVLLASFLGWAIWKWKQAAQAHDDRRYVVYNAGERQEPLNVQGDERQSEDDL